jgi:ribosome-associated heat shock protein Hsp15
VTEATIRLDKWLWQARFFKTRTLAAGVVSSGKVRIDGTPAAKPARMVGPGMVLTFAQGDAIRVVRIVACGTRRGPAPEAQALYDDLTPAWPRDDFPPNPGFEGKGRPGKRERRNMATHRAGGDPFDLE